MKILFAIAAATTAFAVQLPAQAASSASASIDDFAVTLYDLNTSDGLKPFINFSNGPLGQLGSSASSSATDPAVASQSGQSWSLDPFGKALSTAQAGGASAMSSVSGDVYFGGVALSTSGSAAGATQAGYYTSFSGSAEGGSDFGGLSFSLSPFTLAVFSGDANLHTATTVGADPDGLAFEEANASVSLSILGPAATGPASEGQQSTSDGRSLHSSYVLDWDPNTGNYSYSGEHKSIDKSTLSGNFLNLSADQLTGSLFARADIYGNSPVAAVPEPESAAMMLAGLAALGFVARRKGQR